MRGVGLCRGDAAQAQARQNRLIFLYAKKTKSTYPCSSCSSKIIALCAQKSSVTWKKSKRKVDQGRGSSVDNVAAGART